MSYKGGMIKKEYVPDKGDNLRKECHVKVGESCFKCIPDKGGVSAEKQGSMLSCNKKSRVIFHVKL